MIDKSILIEKLKEADLMTDSSIVRWSDFYTAPTESDLGEATARQDTANLMRP